MSKSELSASRWVPSVRLGAHTYRVDTADACLLSQFPHVVAHSYPPAVAGSARRYLLIDDDREGGPVDEVLLPHLLPGRAAHQVVVPVHDRNQLRRLLHGVLERRRSTTAAV